jgi:formylglycine-generating enzyme required for sulfatase activity
MATNPSAHFGPNNPVEQVTWLDAQAYCAALTAQQSAQWSVPAGYQYRLPTEAEWEFACRAATTTEFNVGSDLFCDQARFSFSHHSMSPCFSSGPLPVGSYTPNSWGLYDMHGNVWEWCLDSFAAYTAAAVTDPYFAGGDSRAIRGGGWNFHSYLCRSAYRYFIGPTLTNSTIGFRVVLAPVLVF